MNATQPTDLPSQQTQQKPLEPQPFPLIQVRVMSSQNSRWQFAAIPERLHAGLPLNGWATMPDGVKTPFARVERPSLGVMVLVPAQRRAEWDPTPIDMTLLNEVRYDAGFALHPLVAQLIAISLPRLRLGTDLLEIVGVRAVADSSAHVTHQITYRHRASRLTAWLHATVYSADPTVEWTLQACYGDTVNDGQPQVATMPELVLEVDGARELHVDWVVRNQLASPVERSPSNWSWTMWPAGYRLHRGVVRVGQGAILTDVSARSWRASGGRTFGLCLQWHGNWGPFGAVPVRTQALDARVRADAEQISGPFDAQRGRVQERNAGQTGEQSDFGVASDLAVTRQDPLELTDALWQVEGYALRPVRLVEPSGEMVSTAQHPHAELYNQRPDLSYGLQDRVGWPGKDQILWIPSADCRWTTSDNEHRADLFLHAAARLTGELWIYDIVVNTILLDRMDLHVQRDLPQASRAIGRMALTRAWQAWLGFTESATRGAQNLLRTMAKIPQWTRADGQHIGCQIGDAKRGWGPQPGIHYQGQTSWGDSIVALGAEALARVCDDKPMHDALHATALRIANYVTKTYWRERQDTTNNDGLDYAYAIVDEGGRPVTPEDWPAEQPVQYPFVESGSTRVWITKDCDYWAAACALLLEPTTDRIARVQARVRPFDNAARARWGAITRA